jgi:putative photosynthetic complex assembly protein 2
MADAALAALFAIFIWWFSTGIVLLLNRLSKGGIRLSLFLSSVLGLGALFGLSHSAAQTSTAAAYCAFTCALLVWGWNELSFLTGWITGPRKTELPAGLGEGQRFVQAVRAILWHELGLVAVGLLVLAVTWGKPNQVGAATFLVLWVMRTSAKLNLFLGVRNLSEEFLPPHLAYMKSFFRRRAMNGLFPFAVGGAAVVLAGLAWHAAQPGTPAAQSLGLVLVGTLLALAIVEHAMLVLPLDTTALWRWALRQQRAKTPPQGRAATSALTSIAPITPAPMLTPRGPDV